MNDTLKTGAIALVVALVVALAVGVWNGDRLQQQSLSGGTSNITGNLVVSGNETVGGTSTLTGALAADGGFSVDSPAFTVANTSGDTVIAGTLAANGGLSVDTPAFTVANTSGDVHTGGTLNVTGAAQLNGGLDINVGKFSVASGTGNTNSAGTLTTNGLVVTTTVSLPAGSVTSAAIANITRTVQIPLLSLLECTTDAGAVISTTDGTDAHPSFVNSATDGLGFTLSFDATGGSPDTDHVCGGIQVPNDFVSPVGLVFRATKGAETGANTELINCQISINGAGLLTAGTVTTSGTGSAAYTCVPTTTNLAAGDSMGLTFFITSGGTADDTVNIQSVVFQYLATQ